jgi:hypothetical protein
MAKKAENPARKPPTAKSETTAAAPAPAKKASAPAGGAKPTAPAIDTSLAANTAAALIGNKRAKGSGSSAGGANATAKKESAAFKQLKAGLNKPAAGAMGGAFGVAGQQKKSNLPHHGGKQIGHNQTFGADVNRAGVPRRTPG